MDPCELSPAHIRAIAPYQPGKPLAELERELGIRDAVKLASNENPLGASPKALKAAQAALADIARYPDGNGFDLKQALSRRLGVGQDAIVLGNGSNDVLELVARAFLCPGTSAAYSQYCFAVYPLATQAAGARGITVPAQGHGHDLAAMRAAIGEDTRVVFIANPNNPTGTLLPAAEVEAFLGAVPGHVLVVLDEAYNEYLPPELRADSVAWLARFPNLVLTRTFSKAYGLAGLRVGYALAAPAVTDLLNRVRQPFNVGSVGLAAATAALDDEAFLAESFRVNREGMAQICAGLERLGVEWIPSFGNFLCVRVGDAAAVYQRLLRRAVIVRPVGGYGLPDYLRVSIGLPQENERFLAALGQALHSGSD